MAMPTSCSILAGAEIEARQGAAMQPAQHDQGDDVDQRHQPAADALREVGERIGADAQRQQHADAGEVEQRRLGAAPARGRAARR